MARSDERHRLREDTERGLRDLEDADWDETSEVVASVAAKAAAKTAARLSRPDSDAPDSEQRKPWHRTPAAKTGGILALLAALGAVLKALRDLGILE
jgi:hypothetical protein